MAGKRLKRKNISYNFLYRIKNWFRRCQKPKIMDKKQHTKIVERLEIKQVCEGPDANQTNKESDVEQYGRKADADRDCRRTNGEQNDKRPNTSHVCEELSTVQIHETLKVVDIGISSIIGARAKQQDTVFGYEAGLQAIALVCDGIGGLDSGEAASRIAATSLVDAWFEQADFDNIPNFLKKAAVQADREVYLQTDENGVPICSGTTAAAAVISGNELYWLSVGDSRIYMIREDEIEPLNIDHNYRLELDLRMQRGELTQAEYEAQECRADALISYIGMGNVSLMDINQKAFLLNDGDIVLLCSDGLYRSMQEQDILHMIRAYEQDMQQAADALTAAVQDRKKQDNTSVVLLRYHAANNGGRDDLKTL